MALEHRKKRPLDRSKNNVHDASLIVIASEGKNPEQQYFSMFNSTRVQVIVMPSHDKRSAPKYVIERLNKYREEYQIGKEDSLWLMVDVDRWTRKQLSEVTREASQKKYGLAVSNPSFECWLLLHFEDLAEDELDVDAIIKRLRKHLGGYKKTFLDVEKFRRKIPDAIRRAKAMIKIQTSAGRPVWELTYIRLSKRYEKR